MNDAVRIDVECDFDLRHTTRCWWQVDELELAERLVVTGHLALTLQHMNFNRRLIVIGRGEHFSATRRNGRVALDETRHDTSLCFDTKRQRCDVEEQHVFHVALQHACLNCGADGYDFVGVH